MTFFKILQQFLLPSSIVLILILAGLLFLLRKKKRRFGTGLIIIGLLFYYLFSTAAVSNFLISPLENKYSFLKTEEMGRADKAVLLLGGREADILRGSEVLRIYYLKDGQIEIIISGTDPVLPSSEEALAVKKFFANRGVAEENIVIEGQSRNTWENIRNVKEIVQEEPFFLVTSAYHMERAIKEFEKVRAKPSPAPTDFKIKTRERSVFNFLPDIQNLRNSDLAFREYLAILWYNIK